MQHLCILRTYREFPCLPWISDRLPVAGRRVPAAHADDVRFLARQEVDVLMTSLDDVTFLARQEVGSVVFLSTRYMIRYLYYSHHCFKLLLLRENLQIISLFCILLINSIFHVHSYSILVIIIFAITHYFKETQILKPTKTNLRNKRKNKPQTDIDSQYTRPPADFLESPLGASASCSVF